MSEQERTLSEFFKYFFATLCSWKSIMEQISLFLSPIFRQCEQLRLCERVQLDEKFLQKFPCVKTKLLGKIRLGIEEEISSVSKLEEEMKSHVDGLKTRLTSVEKAFLKSKNEESSDINPLIPSFDDLFEHASDIWKCFHILWMGLKTSIETVNYSSKSSVNKISESLQKFEKFEHHFNYIADLTQYLRT
ncbi:uncharacterized protein LOC129003780 [Macrosteles quadrilineatus]|uniref:uncharacterized protein LOC129003231 n=1 Tax=Macrosteles quadrilineatus TaxID=74068 RepID=UPI0023E28527|nr:uncharacterized protein LOC129003231 [Macrosteles quadrilineatus]XP_054288056.1 uncharacterized protein LOC129003780 [Macrosteles quadrilineatus]